MRSAHLTRVAVAGCALAALAVQFSPAYAGSSGSTAKPAAGSTGTASVFKANPVQSSGNENLTDDNDSATAVPASEYATVQLRNLDGSGYLTLVRNAFAARGITF